MAAVKLAISKLRTDCGTQPRAALNMAIVKDYADAMRAGAKFPPVDAFYDGTDYWLADGFHRCRAASVAELAEIAATVHQGTRQDAQWFSYAANKTNGIYRSNEDKQRAVKAALKHPKSASMSDSAIAKHLGVDHVTIGHWRNKLCPTCEIHKLTKRTGLDGRTRNVANIGKARSAKLAPPPPASLPKAAPVAAPAPPPAPLPKAAPVAAPAPPPAPLPKPTPAAPQQVATPTPQPMATREPDSPPEESAETTERRIAMKPHALISACRNMLAWTWMEHKLLDMDETEIAVIKKASELLDRIVRKCTPNTGASGATEQPC
jgi:hypothetical protein